MNETAEALKNRTVTIQHKGVVNLPSDVQPERWVGLWLIATFRATDITIRARAGVQTFVDKKSHRRTWLQLPVCVQRMLSMPLTAVIDDPVLMEDTGEPSVAVYPIRDVVSFRAQTAVTGGKDSFGICIPSAYVRGIEAVGWSDDVEARLVFDGGLCVTFPTCINRSRAYVASSHRTETKMGIRIRSDIVHTHNLLPKTPLLIILSPIAPVRVVQNQQFDWCKFLRRGSSVLEQDGVITLVAPYVDSYHMNRYADPLTAARFCGIYKAEGSKTGNAPSLSGSLLKMIRWVRDVAVFHFGLSEGRVSLRYTPGNVDKDFAVKQIVETFGQQPHSIQENPRITSVVADLCLAGGIDFKTMILNACGFLSGDTVDPAMQREFVLGFMDGDGSILARDGAPGVYLTLAGTSDEMMLFSRLVSKVFDWECTGHDGSGEWRKSLTVARGVQLLALGAFPFSASRGRLFTSIGPFMCKLAKFAAGTPLQALPGWQGLTRHGYVTRQPDDSVGLSDEAIEALERWKGLADEYTELMIRDPDSRLSFTGRKCVPYVLNMVPAVPAPIR